MNPKIGLTFAAILRTALRHDPDIVLVGEMRDQETAEIGLRAAMTGHMVFSTLHTQDAVSTVSRLLDMGTQGYLIAAALDGILAQRLLRRLCDNCAHAVEPGVHQAAWLSRYLTAEQIAATKFAEGMGCTYCNMTGYRGRVGVVRAARDRCRYRRRDSPHRSRGARSARRAAAELHPARAARAAVCDRRRDVGRRGHALDVRARGARAALEPASTTCCAARPPPRRADRPTARRRAKPCPRSATTAEPRAAKPWPGSLESESAEALATHLFARGITPIDIKPVAETHDVLAELWQRLGGGRPTHHGSDPVLAADVLDHEGRRAAAARHAEHRGLDGESRHARDVAGGHREPARRPRPVVRVRPFSRRVLEVLFERDQGRRELRHARDWRSCACTSTSACRSGFATRSKLRCAIPATVIVAIAIAMGVITMFVLPKFAPIFAALGNNLPWATRVLLGVSSFTSNYWYLVHRRRRGGYACVQALGRRARWSLPVGQDSSCVRRSSAASSAARVWRRSAARSR